MKFIIYSPGSPNHGKTGETFDIPKWGDGAITLKSDDGSLFGWTKDIHKLKPNNIYWRIRIKLEKL